VTPIIFVETTIAGMKALVEIVPPPDGAPAAIVDAFARRAQANIHGRCACGGRIEVPNRAQRRAAQRKHQPARARFEHEPNCNVTDENLVAAVKAWRAETT
jgi:hypothetical protein